MLGQATAPVAPELAAARQQLRQAKTVPELETVRAKLEGLALAARTANDLAAENDALYTLGNCLVALQQDVAAIAVWEPVLAYRRQSGDRFQQSLTQHNLAVRYWITGESLRALPLLEELLSLRRDLKDDFGLALSHQALANVHYSLGELANALEQYQQALRLWEKLGQKQGLADTRNSIGYMYTLLGDTQRAETELEASIRLWQELKSAAGEANARNNLAVNALAQAKYQRVVELSERTLPVFEQGHDRRAQAYALHNVANAYSGLKDYSKAIAYYERSRRLKQEVKDPHGEAYSIQGQAEAEWALGRPARARALFEEALQMRREIADRAGLIATLGASARLERAARNLLVAKSRMAEAINLIESLRQKLISEDLRTTYFATQRDYYDFYIEVLLELKEDSIALEVAERARGRRLLDRLSETLAGVKQGANSSFQAEERRLERRIQAAADRLRRQVASGVAKPGGQSEIAGLMRADQDLRERIRRSNPAYGNLVAPLPLQVGQMQAMLGPGDVLLHYFRGRLDGRQRLHVWALSPDRVEHHLLAEEPKQEDLGLLSQWLLGPLGRSLTGAKRVIVSSDGMAEAVPFAALPWKGMPLVGSVELSSLPSLTALAVQRQRRLGAAPKTLLAVGDAVYGAPDARLPALQAVTEGGLPRLRFSRIEVEKLSNMVGPGKVDVLLDFQASREAFLGKRLGDYQILHLATHTDLDPAQPELSGIVLSQYSTEAKVQEGLLRLPEIFNLELRAQLVVLSACRSALGQRVRGEGLLSLARGFLYAGAGAVLATLWDVDDRASALLLSRFYRAMLIEKLAPPAALRVAQNEIRRDPQFADPRYWAAYTLWGEWR